MKNSGIEFAKRWLPVIGWMGVIFYFSSQSILPGAAVIWWDYIFKKSAHMFVYGVLFFLVARAVTWKRKVKAGDYLSTLIICWLYAVSDEFHQSLTPGRHPQITDVGFDLLGMGVAFLRLKNLI